MTDDQPTVAACTTCHTEHTVCFVSGDHSVLTGWCCNCGTITTRNGKSMTPRILDRLREFASEFLPGDTDD